MQEKQTLINNLKINYKIFGKGNIPIILLHGWGIDSDKYIETAKQLLLQTESYGLQIKIIIPDLPGFGKSDKPRLPDRQTPQVWSVDNYVDLVKEFIEMSLRTLQQQGEAIPCFGAHSAGLLPAYRQAGAADTPRNDKVILIGHSFGGRIAIKFCAKYPEKINSLILTGAAGIKHSLSIKQKIFFIAAKIGKLFFSLPLINKLEKLAQKVLYKATREKDYYKAQGMMKETFKKVISEDLTPYLEKITNPTLLIWGKNDRSTPLRDAFLMKEKIKNCELAIVENYNHGLPYKNSEEFSRIATNFIKKIG